MATTRRKTTKGEAKGASKGASQSASKGASQGAPKSASKGASQSASKSASDELAKKGAGKAAPAKTVPARKKGEAGGKEKSCRHRMLVMNPGSTSTKVAVYEDERNVFTESLSHSKVVLEEFDTVWSQYEFRKQEILKALEARGISLADFTAVVARGGLLKPIPSGTYRINEAMIDDLRIGVQGHHASNLGAVLAYGIAWDHNLPSFIADPPSVDEFEPLARFSGIPDYPRTSLLHALNIKATARLAAKEMGKPLDKLNFIVAHLGGGITVCAMRRGKMINVNRGIGEGPFSPERSGSLPLTQFLDMCYSGKYTKKQMMKKLAGEGGLVGYLGTNNSLQVEERANSGDEYARLVYEAMAYQVAEEIGSRATNLKGEVDAILLTGSLARSPIFCDWIEERTNFIAKARRYPGENEMQALALAALRVLDGEEPAMTYEPEKKTLGVLHWGNVAEYQELKTILEEDLAAAGFVFRKEGENLDIVYRHCRGDHFELVDAAKHLREMNVDVILTIGSPSAEAVKRVLKGENVPVVCGGLYDPFVMGLAGGTREEDTGNVYAVYYRVGLQEQVEELLSLIVPDLKKVGIVYRAGELQADIQYDELSRVCQELELELVAYPAQTTADLKDAATYLARKGVDAVYLTADMNIAEATREDLRCLTERFLTFCSLESVFTRGATCGYVASWKEISHLTAETVTHLLEGYWPQRRTLQSTHMKKLLNLDKAKSVGLHIDRRILERDDVILVGGQTTSPGADAPTGGQAGKPGKPAKTARAGKAK